MLDEKKFNGKVNYAPGDLEFYKKMWSIDPEAAKTWIVNRLNTLIEIQEYIREEIKQLRDMSNYNEDKKALDYYNLTGGDKRRACGGNKKIIIDYMRENLNKDVRTIDMINKFISLGLMTEKSKANIYNTVIVLAKEGIIKKTGFGMYTLTNSESQQ